MSRAKEPAGRWLGFRWTGDPDMGFGPKQPGGWIYALMPFWRRVPRSSSAPVGTSEKAEALRRQKMTPVKAFACPSRRPDGLGFGPEHSINARATSGSLVAKSDYAGNGGCNIPQGAGPAGPASHPLPRALSEPFVCNGLPTKQYAAKFDGVVIPRFGLKLAKITDGTSKTMYRGRTLLAQDLSRSELTAPTCPRTTIRCIRGTTGMSSGMPARGCTRLARSCPVCPGATMKDPEAATYRFGSSHPGGLLAVHCDDSVHFVRI